MSATPRICPECGAEFVPRHHLQGCCSDECARERHKRLTVESRARSRKKKRKADADARKEKMNRRAAFFAERDAAFESIGLPPERVTIGANGQRIVTRGSCFGGCMADITHIMQPAASKES